METRPTTGTLAECSSYCVDALALVPQRREGLGNQGNQANSGHTSSYCVASLWHFLRGEVMEPQVGNHGKSAPVCMPVRFSRIRCVSQVSQVSQGLEPQRNRANTVGQFANYEILRGRAWAPGITETRPTAGTLAESGEYCADALAPAKWPTPWGSLRTLLPGQPRAQ